MSRNLLDTVKFLQVFSNWLENVHICGKFSAENENCIEHLIEQININFNLNFLTPCWDETVFLLH